MYHIFNTCMTCCCLLTCCLCLLVVYLQPYIQGIAMSQSESSQTKPPLSQETFDYLWKNLEDITDQGWVKMFTCLLFTVWRQTQVSDVYYTCMWCSQVDNEWQLYYVVLWFVLWPSVRGLEFSSMSHQVQWFKCPRFKYPRFKYPDGLLDHVFLY